MILYCVATWIKKGGTISFTFTSQLTKEDNLFDNIYFLTLTTREDVFLRSDDEQHQITPYGALIRDYLPALDLPGELALHAWKMTSHTLYLLVICQDAVPDDIRMLPGYIPLCITKKMRAFKTVTTRMINRCYRMKGIPFWRKGYSLKYAGTLQQIIIKLAS